MVGDQEIVNMTYSNSAIERVESKPIVLEFIICKITLEVEWG